MSFGTPLILELAAAPFVVHGPPANLVSILSPNGGGDVRNKLKTFALSIARTHAKLDQ